jgi:hypothetical protein
MNFSANVEVGRLTASEDDSTIVGFTADIKIHCVECGKPFEFVGLPMGSSPMQPMCSVDGQEARMPIMPQGEQMRMDLAGFTIRKISD